MFDGIPGRTLATPDEERFCTVHERLSDGFLVLELATAHYNKKESLYQNRGYIEQSDLSDVKAQLKKLDRDALSRCIKIAVLHHHPVLIPAFAEPGREYDAVVNGAHLLNLLNDFGFHLILHGHKHNPHSFSHDVTCGWHENPSFPLLIIAGGSASSTSLPQNGGNTYNIINTRHMFGSNETRVQVTTRGLQCQDEYNRPLLRSEWYWETIKQVDKLLIQNSGWSYGKVNRRPFDGASDAGNETFRDSEYSRLRQNMPVVDVVPSLKRDQEFEARMKIVGHKYRTDVPVTVIWSAGDKFKVATCFREENPDFRSTFSYFEPMLIQVTMIFSDGYQCHSYIYAHERI